MLASDEAAEAERDFESWMTVSNPSRSVTRLAMDRSAAASAA